MSAKQQADSASAFEAGGQRGGGSQAGCRLRAQGGPGLDNRSTTSVPPAHPHQPHPRPGLPGQGNLIKKKKKKDGIEGM